MAKRDEHFPWIASNIDRIAGTLREPNKPTPASQEGTHPLNETRPSKETRPQVATQTQSLDNCPTKDIPGLSKKNNLYVIINYLDNSILYYNYDNLMAFINLGILNIAEVRVFRFFFYLFLM